MHFFVVFFLQPAGLRRGEGLSEGVSEGVRIEEGVPVGDSREKAAKELGEIPRFHEMRL